MEAQFYCSTRIVVRVTVAVSSVILIIAYLGSCRSEMRSELGSEGEMRLGGKCQLLGSCRQRGRKREMDVGPDASQRSCYCDQSCALYDDCCSDANWTEPLSRRIELGAGRLRERRRDWLCHRVNPIFGDFLLRASCHAHWLEEQSESPQLGRLVQRRCEYVKDRGKTEAEEDPMGMMMPITDLASGVTYANSYCLRCNKLSAPAKLIYWSPLLECSYNLDTDDRTNLIDLVRANAGQALEYSAKRNRWLVKLPEAASAAERNATGPQLGERICSVTPTVPDAVDHMIRYCRSNTIDHCPSDGRASNESARARLECEHGHQALIYSQTSDKVYFNLACARCNHERQVFCEPKMRKNIVGLSPTASESANSTASKAGESEDPDEPIAGLGSRSEGRSQSADGSPNSGSFSVLLDIYPQNDEQVGVVHQCPSAQSQVYDPFFSTCRDVVCGLNQQFQAGKCVNLRQNLYANFTALSVQMAAANHTQSATAAPATPATPPLASKPEQASDGSEGGPMDLLARLNVSELPEPSVESRRQFAECGRIHVEPEHYHLFTINQPASLAAANGSGSGVRLLTSQQVTPSGSLNLNPNLAAAKGVWAFVEPYNLTLASTQFELVRSSARVDHLSLLICSPFASDLVAKFKPAMAYTTSVCLSVSILSLSLYLLLYCLSAFDLRRLAARTASEQKKSAGEESNRQRARHSRASNDSQLQSPSSGGQRSQSLSSRGVACLSGSLLAAYLLFILGHHQTASSLTCRLLAVSLYFCFMLAFSWMLLLSYDIWRTLRLATCQLRAPAMHAQSRRFIAYSLAAILASGSIVLLAVLLDHLPACPPPVAPPGAECAHQTELGRLLSAYRPKFGQSQRSCWFSNRRALALFFGLPLAVIMLLNLLFFLHSSFMVIRTSSRSSRHLKESSPRQSPASSEQSGRGQPKLVSLAERLNSLSSLDSGSSQSEFQTQNSLTSAQTLQSQLSSDASSSCSNCDEPLDGAPSAKSKRKLEPSESCSSLTNHSMGAASISASLALKYDAQLHNLSSLMASVVKDYRLYFRLSTIMGLTWLSGLVASLVDSSDLLWYLFVVLNALQGLFIFIAFGCKRSKLANLRILADYLKFCLKANR